MEAKELKKALSAIKRDGLNPALYQVVSDAPGYWVIKHRITGEIKAVGK